MIRTIYGNLKNIKNYNKIDKNQSKNINLRVHKKRQRMC